MMSQEELAVVTGLISNGLFWLMQSGTSVTLKSLFDKNRRRKSLPFERVAVDEVLREGLELVWSKRKALLLPDQINPFLSSPDAEVVVRRIFANLVAGTNELESTIQAELASFLTYHNKGKKLSDNVVKNTFELLNDSCILALRRYMRATGSLTVNAQDIINATSFRRIEAQVESLKAIQQSNAILAVDRVNFRTLEGKYRSQMRGAHGVIVPQSIQRVDKVPIDDLYVPSDLLAPDRVQDPRVNIARLLNSGFRSVVLGNPGGGKSTLSDKICFELAESSNSSRQQMIPFHIILRDFASDERSNSMSFVDFLVQQSKAKYQTPAPGDFFESALSSGRAFVCFDGLDELLDTADRAAITERIEAFARAYPSCPLLVTSREVGYDEAPLNAKLFETYKLAEFSTSQTEEYCRKWFGRIEGLTLEERQAKVGAFMHESQVAPDLRSNPLMLSLMCTLYNEEGYIPRNRPDVYEKCATLLFEKWDRRRGIIVDLPFEAQVDPAMKFLAYWIYTNQELQKGVTESQIVDKVSEYFRQRLFDDIDEARSAAQSFTDFCRGRAWVFTDVGTKPGGENLYNFTHRTFLEYFAACHLVRIHRTPDTLIGVVIPRIEKGQWEVVAELSVQILNKQSEGAIDDLFINALPRLTSDNRTSEQNIFKFLLRCMSVVTATPSVTRDTTANLLDWAYKSHIADRRSRSEWRLGHVRSIGYDSPLGFCVTSLLEVTRESRTQVQKSLEQFLVALLGKNHVREHLIAIEVLDVLKERYSWHGVTSEATEAWRRWSQIQLKSHAKSLVQLWDKDSSIACLLFLEGLLSSNDLIEKYSVSILFSMRPSNLSRNMLFGPIAYQIVGCILGARWASCSEDLLSSFVQALDRLYKQIERDAEVPLLDPMLTLRSMDEFSDPSESLTQRVQKACKAQGERAAFYALLSCSRASKYRDRIEGSQGASDSAPNTDPVRSMLGAAHSDPENLYALYLDAGLDEDHARTIVSYIARAKNGRKK